MLLPNELEGEPADSFAVLYANARTPGRFTGVLAEADLYLRAVENTLVFSSPTGTSHGSPYWYDRHVPFILYGAGVAPGRSEEGVFTYDMAPTLAGLAGIEFPSDLDGRDLNR